MKKLYFITIGFFVTLMVCFMIIGSIKEYPSQYCISHVEMQRVEIEDSYGEKSKDSSLTNYYILSIVLDNAKIKKTISDCQPYDEGIADPVKSLDILDKQGHNMNEQLRCVQIINGFSYAKVSITDVRLRRLCNMFQKLLIICRKRAVKKCTTIVCCWLAIKLIFLKMELYI